MAFAINQAFPSDGVVVSARKLGDAALRPYACTTESQETAVPVIQQVQACGGTHK